MAEKVCAVCGKKVGFGSYKISDGQRACAKCMKKAGYGMTNSFNEIRSITLDDLRRDAKAEKKALKLDKKQQQIENANRLKEFKADLKVSSYLLIDSQKRQFKIKGLINGLTIHDLDSIRGYEIVENGGSVTSGGLGRAAVGALTFGGAGAIVGAITGKKHSTSIIDSLQVKILMADIETPVLFIDLISSKTKRTSIIYKTAVKEAEKIVYLLESQFEDSADLEQQESTRETLSNADEIRKFKELLDDGIISKDEFEKKKNDLLGL